MKRIFAIVLAFCLCLTAAAALGEAAASEDAATSRLPEGLVREPITSMWIEDDKLVQAEGTAAFREGDSSVMYISVREYYDACRYLGITRTPEIETDENGLYVIRDNGSAAVFLREDNAFYYVDVDLFRSDTYSLSGGDLISTLPYQLNDNGDTLVDAEGTPLVNLIWRQDSSASFMRTGATVGASLDVYEIPAYWTEDDLYLPLAAVNTLLSSTSNPLTMICVGNVFFSFYGVQPDSVCADENGLTMMNHYYALQTHERSEALTALNYNLLCLDLDLNYGLKEEHGINDGFDEYLATIGLQEQMLEADGRAFYNALSTLTRAYFADFHSGTKLAGPYAGAGYSYKPTSVPASTRYVIESDDRFADARYQAGLTERVELQSGGTTLQIKENYQEVGDTAYITFDSFEYQDYDYYSSDFQNEIADYIRHDNIALISYANSRISREDSPVRRVVIDLSCNGGGSVDTAVFLASWVLGSCRLSVTNPTTGANYTTVYQADVNLDGKITEEDCLDSNQVKLYCLTSQSSFSCGNLVPAMFKESGMVTMLGQTTGGGACIVQPRITADGTVFNYSGSWRLCTVKNGCYYSVDRGVDPDFVIRDTAHFYDREWLTEYIATLP